MMKTVSVGTAAILALWTIGCEDGSVDEAFTAAAASSQSDITAVQIAADDDEFEAMVMENLAKHKTGLIISPTSTLAATIKTVDGVEIDFVVNEAGVTVYEQGKVGTSPRVRDMDSRLGPVALFQSLAPNEAVPNALMEAEINAGKSIDRLAGQESVADMESDIEDSEELPNQNIDETTMSPRSVDDSLCPASFFTNKFCVNPGWHVCSTRRTGDYKLTKSDKNDSSVAACSYRGTIVNRLRYRPWYTWHVEERQTLDAGHWGHIYHYDWHTDFDMEARVYEATGDGYHHGVYWM